MTTPCEHGSNDREYCAGCLRKIIDSHREFTSRVFSALGLDEAASDAELFRAIDAVNGDRDRLRAMTSAADDTQRTLMRVIERDRTVVARVLTSLLREVSSREWVRESRGSYAWDDDRYRDEFGAAIRAIRKEAENLRTVAQDMTNCPQNTDDVRRARADLDAVKQ